MRQSFVLRLLLPLLFIIFTGAYSNAQIAAWDLTGEGAVSTVTTSAADVYNANLDASNLLTRGAGAAWSTGGNSFRTVGFQNNGIATTNTDYFQFTLSASTGFLLSLSTIDARFAGTATFAAGAGVSSQFAYSLDGTNFTLIGSPSVNIGTPATLGQINLSGITDLQNIPAATTVTFRYYASGQTTTGGWGFNSPSAGTYGLAIGGTVTSAISSNANLSNLVLSSGPLTPAFATATTSYTANVANGVSSVTVTPTVQEANATVTVNGNAVTSGSPSGAIALNVGLNTITTVVTAQDLATTKTYTIDVTRAAAGTPTLTLTSPLPAFGTACINSTTGANSFLLDGSDLDGSNGSTITLAALSGFSYCETAGGTYTSTLSFTYTGSGFAGKQIFVKFSPTAVQSYNGDIAVSGGGVAGINVAASGSGVNTAGSVTTGTATAIAATSATLPGTISVIGCSPVTAYGIEYSLTSGFPNGTGTQVPASNLAAGSFSVGLTGLAPNSRVYYKAYITDGSGTTWGAQDAFNLLPLPVPMALQPGLSFTETFTDILNWDNFFINGAGANHWDGLSTNGTTPIPSATILTTQTNSFQTPASPGANVTSGGVQKGTDQLPSGTQSIVLLSTGTANNTTSAALDFYADFTGVNAGTLSFDYSTVNNGTGDRPGSLRVYGTTDGVTYSEITNVVNFTNNTPLSDAKSNIPLPASFNNNANARIRFYYYNGETGGTSGARPKISIDNVKITAIATTPCAAPTAPATNLIFGTITDVSIAGSFTAASPASDGYLVVASTNSSLNGNPVDGQNYSIGDNIGDGFVVANGNSTSFTATGLTALTQYYFYIFSVNSICTGGPLYYTTSVLNGTATTIAGLPPCAAPAGQPTGLVFGTTTTTSVQGSFTATTANGYLVVRSTTATLSSNPINGASYNTGDPIGGGFVVQQGAATSFTASSLNPNTTYYFFVFALNSAACVNGPAYNITAPLTGSQSTIPLPPCTSPATQPTSLLLSATNNSVSGTFTAALDADNYLIVRSTSAALGAAPVDNTDYTIGDPLGNGFVVANSGNLSFVATGLTPATSYYFFVFASNKICSGGTKYAGTAALTNNISTTNAPSSNYYFGTLHSHSDYSDGNKDNPGYTPADDYAYAKNSLCMDYLGISEHNHFSSVDNPGNTITNFHQGSTQANTFTTNNPGFLAMYGMEWGVISGGGHVLIYGDGMDNLWGWESGSGLWGASNNYDVFVPKNVYTGSTGLFKTVNDNIATNTFATLAHPGQNDFNGLANLAYDAVADNAITGVCVESGPATSTNTTYSNPGSSMGTLWYYQTLLAKGYHAGPTIDHDNHNTTFGRTTYSRTAIIAPALTKTALVNAVRNMNFYATQDCDTKVDFTVNTRIMGSILTDRYAPNIAVTLSDATTSLSGAVIRVMFGVPGSGVLPVKIDSAIGSTLNFTDNSLANLATGYYYLDITNGSSRIVTAPVWYTRNDANGVLPAPLSVFTVTKADAVAKINWTTEQELNTSHFAVERSTDGRNWISITTVTAKGNSTTKTNYEAYDNAPVRGINYYRLRQVDKNGKFELSAVRNALFDSRNTVEIAPNPAKDYINLYIGKTAARQTAANIQVLNAAGKVVYTTTSSLSHVQISTSNIAKGLYFVKVITEEGTSTLRVMVQ